MCNGSLLKSAFTRRRPSNIKLEERKRSPPPNLPSRLIDLPWRREELAPSSSTTKKNTLQQVESRWFDDLVGNSRSCLHRRRWRETRPLPVSAFSRPMEDRWKRLQQCNTVSSQSFADEKTSWRPICLHLGRRGIGMTVYHYLSVFMSIYLYCYLYQ